MQTEKDTIGLSQDADFYSLLNLPTTATTQQINKQFRTISRSLHPDKHPSVGQQARMLDLDQQIVESNDDPTIRQEIYGEVQRAYGYLTNPLTKIIYDEYGVSGLIVYEKSKK